ncbi:MAG: UPF0280 family protein [Methanimicrococcus sp.]|nr:UPF0280 family protein [Methanimicrococcus sp.]
MYHKTHFQVKETIVTILADKPEFFKAAEESILADRFVIENYIASYPFFEATLESFEADKNAPPVIQKMIASGNTFGIGPMSAVAGVIAESAVLQMKKAGAVFALVDNGGDMAIYNIGEKPTVVGIYTGNKISNLGFSVSPSEEIIGICTSSGTVGHSISFGISDAAVVFSKDVALADAAATALGNALLEKGQENIKKAFSVFDHVPEIDGAVLIEGENVGFFGTLPPLVKAKVDYDLITKG